MKWEQELYSSFVYKEPKPFFHTVETDDGVVGFSFADVSEAKEMLGTILYAKSAPPSQASGPPAAGGKSSGSSSKPAAKEEGKKEKKKGFFAGLKSKMFGDDEPEPEIVLGKPTGFRHQSHIGWDPEKGFEVDNIPSDWKKLFQQAGIKKSELRDAETAKYVMGVLNEAIASGDMPPPGPAPTPPAPTGNAPPAPAPVGGGPPPPPPPPPGGGAPRPPPQAPSGGGAGTAPPAPAPPAGGGGGGDESRDGLLSQIRGGTQLRKVDPTAVPDISNLSQAKTNDLASVLASAMKGRRQDMNNEEANDNGAGDDEWSD